MSVPTNPGESDNRAGLAIDRLGSTSHRGLMPKLAAATATRGALSITGYGGTAAIGADPATASVAGALVPGDFSKVAQLVTATAWIAPTFATNWGNFGGSWRVVQYRKDATGRVWLRGMAAKAVAVGAADIIFTLPAGFRPAADEYFAVNSNSAFGALFVTSGGAVTVGVGNAAYVSLSGLSFETS